MKSRPGFISAQLYQGVGGSRAFTNIAVWESAAALKAAFASSAFSRSLGAEDQA